MDDFLNELQAYHNSGKTWRECREKFNISFSAISKLSKSGQFKSRSFSEAITLSLSKNPRKLSQKTKDKISKARKNYLSNNPERVPYILNHSSKTSSPEKYFLNYFSEKFLHKYPVLGFRLDFADPHKKIDLEIDGDQHFLDKRIANHDARRNAKLLSNGWVIARIRWSLFKPLSDEDKETLIKLVLDHSFSEIKNDCFVFLS
jgi:hypothetical protein